MCAIDNILSTINWKYTVTLKNSGINNSEKEEIHILDLEKYLHLFSLKVQLSVAEGGKQTLRNIFLLFLLIAINTFVIHFMILTDYLKIMAPPVV